MKTTPMHERWQEGRGLKSTKLKNWSCRSKNLIALEGMVQRKRWVLFLGVIG